MCVNIFHGDFMNNKEILKIAEQEGFCKAEIIDTERIVFDSAFRPYCEENLCGQYNCNYSCPEFCGTPEEMRARVLRHGRALVLQMIWEFPTLTDSDAFKNSKKVQNSATIRVIQRLREAGHQGFMVGSSGCNLCSPCKATAGEECPFPEMRFSCMSAYCIYVKKLADECEMEYDYKNGKLPFFSMYVFD